MSWWAELEARYESAEDAADAFEVVGRQAGLEATLDGAKISARYDYGERSKYGPVRPALGLLHEAFDPVADDEHYRAWPVELTLRAHWTE